MKKKTFGFNIVMYCVNSSTGEKYTSVGISFDFEFNRDELVGKWLHAIEGVEGDTLDTLYFIPGDYTFEQLYQIADTGLPESARLLYSQKPPYNSRGCKTGYIKVCER